MESFASKKVWAEFGYFSGVRLRALFLADYWLEMPSGPLCFGFPKCQFALQRLPGRYSASKMKITMLNNPIENWHSITFAIFQPFERSHSQWKGITHRHTYQEKGNTPGHFRVYHRTHLESIRMAGILMKKKNTFRWKWPTA